MGNRNKRYTIEVDEEQLMLISKCVEDCSRFAAGQVEMDNTLWEIDCKDMAKVKDRLRDIKGCVTPGLAMNESYGWSGGSCKNKAQASFIAKTYALYREILHVVTVENHNKETDGCNVYLSPTLRCEDAELPIVKVKKDDNDAE